MFAGVGVALRACQAPVGRGLKVLVLAEFEGAGDVLRAGVAECCGLFDGAQGFKVVFRRGGAFTLEDVDAALEEVLGAFGDGRGAAVGGAVWGA